MNFDLLFPTLGNGPTEEKTKCVMFRKGSTEACLSWLFGPGGTTLLIPLCGAEFGTDCTPET